jgi:large subunit ribosomal protein L17
MRHNVAHRKLGRVTEHRLAMLRNQAISLLRHKRIETTIPKAKELRPFVERLITIAKRGLAAGDSKAQTLNARRLVLAELPDTAVVSELFSEIAPTFADRPGGYTRILRVGFRRGDGAETAQIELVGFEWKEEEKPAEGEEGDAPKKSKGLGERLRQTARNLRGGKDTGGSKGQAKGQTQGATRKTTTPRKAGGS